MDSCRGGGEGGRVESSTQPEEMEEGQGSLPDFSVTDLKATPTALVSHVAGWEGQSVLGKFPRPCWPESAWRQTSFERIAHPTSRAGTRGSPHLCTQLRHSSPLLSPRAISPPQHLLTVTDRALGKETRQPSALVPS